jgi:hypothetical protein
MEILYQRLSEILTSQIVCASAHQGYEVIIRSGQVGMGLGHESIARGDRTGHRAWRKYSYRGTGADTDVPSNGGEPGIGHRGGAQDSKSRGRSKGRLGGHVRNHQE